MRNKKLLLPLHLVVFTGLVMVVAAGIGRGFSVALQSLIIEIYDDSTLFSNTFAVVSTMSIVVAIFIPVVAHYIRYKLLFLITVLFYVASFFAFSPEVVSSPVWLYVFCITWTIGATGTQILGSTLLNVALPDGRRATYLSIANVFFYASLAVMPLFVGWLGYGHDSSLYRVFGFILVAVALPFVLSKEPQSLNMPKEIQPSFDKGKLSFLKKFTYGMTLLYEHPMVLTVTIIAGINLGTFGALLIVWAESYANVSLANAAYLQSMLGLGGMALSVPWGYFTDRVGLMPALMVCLASFCGCYFILSLDDYIFKVDIVALFLVGGCIAALFSISTAIVGDTFRGVRQVTAATSGAMLIKSVLGVGMVYILGESIDHWGAISANIILIVFNGVGMGILLYLKCQAAAKVKARIVNGYIIPNP